MKTVLLLEERIASQSGKLEQLAERVVEMERRSAMTEGRMEGFLAGVASYSAGRARAPVIDGSEVIERKSVRTAPLPLEEDSTA